MSPYFFGHYLNTTHCSCLPFEKVIFRFWMSYNLKLNCIFRQWHTVAHHVISPFLFQDPLLGSSLMIIELLSSHQLWNPFRTDYLAGLHTLVTEEEWCLRQNMR